ncbi:chemotaxis protein CheW [Pseudomonas lini]
MDLSFWICLAVVFGVVILVTLIIHYWSYPRIDAKPSPSIEPWTEVASDELEGFQRSTTEQLSDVSAVLSSSTVTALKVEQISSQAIRTAVGQTLPSATRAKDAAQIAGKLQYLTDLTYQMLEKKQTLRRTTVDPLLIANKTAPNRLYLCFTLDDESFAVSMWSVHAVVEAAQLVTKPGLSPQFRRAIRLGRALVPVIDLGAHLYGQPGRIGAHTKIAVLEVTVGDRLHKVGVVVDAVGAILEIPSIEIEPTVSFDSKVGIEFTFGTITFNSQRVTLLAVGQGSSSNESVVLRSLTRSAEQNGLST